jgi:hypothetical protein
MVQLMGKSPDDEFEKLNSQILSINTHQSESPQKAFFLPSHLAGAKERESGRQSNQGARKSSSPSP